MEEDVLNALQTRTAYLPGGFDRDGKIIIVVNILNDLQLWNRRNLELSITYLKRSLSPTILLKGVTVIVDAQKSTRRITRAHARTIFSLFGDLSVNLYLVRAEGFWEKHVEPCTKSRTANEPIVLSMSRLSKYFDLCNLPIELGGSLHFNYDLWLQQRKSIDEFQKMYEQTLNAMENLHVFLLSNKSLRPAEADVEVKNCVQMHASVQRIIEEAIEMGNRILLRLGEVYLQPKPAQKSNGPIPTNTIAATTTTSAVASASACPTSTISPISQTATATAAASCSLSQSPPAFKYPLPPDLMCERSRIELRLNAIERKQTEIRTAWLDLLRSLREMRELATLEEGVTFVTNWILNTAEELLSRQHLVGDDVCTCETLRTAHDTLEMECRGTYGIYAELLYKIDSFKGTKDSYAFRDLISQRDFMNFVCRSFAQRLERRRNVLITSLRFFRLVTEYFERTTEVFETLVIGNVDDVKENLSAAEAHLKELKTSQADLAQIERELLREGEKLSDMLSMPIKDALGRDLNIDYSNDIHNIREILDTTIARRNLFDDSVELQKLTLEQVTHIQTYEADARMAIQWMIDLYNVMIKYHSHVGSNIHEIQVQKEELQVFQETGKSIYQYGCQLLEASQALRISCKLDENIAKDLLHQLIRTWCSLQTISQEHMIRLRVSAVFHRSVEEYCQQMIALEFSVRSLWNPESPMIITTTTRHHLNNDASNNESRSNTTTTTTITTTGSSSGISSVSDLSSPTNTGGSSLAEDNRRDRLQKCLLEREKLLLEVGRMVRLGRLLKTRLREPFILDTETGKSVAAEDLALDRDITPTSLEERIAFDANNIVDISTASSSTPTSTTSENSTALPAAAAAAAAATLAKKPPTTIVIDPTGNNHIACEAISQKLNDIAAVAGSLDAAIRDVQNGADVSSTSSSEKKPNACRESSSSSGEDWHSHSTEDDSFATASENNFTPQSHSSSFQTASGHNSRLQTPSAKGSFDASEADDSTLSALTDLPEQLMISPNNASFDSSDRSYLSAKQLSSSPDSRNYDNYNQNNINNSDISDHFNVVDNYGNDDDNDDDAENSVAGIEDLRSQSVTPTPGDAHHQSIPIDSETELQSYIADAPSMEILTEEQGMPLTSVTPEVSATECSATNQQMQRLSQQRDTNSIQKANSAWRRSKYYENITKQTIRGFL